MGEKNTISLLTSINGYLKAMAEQAKQNKGPEQAAQNTQATMTKNLNQGSVLSGAVTANPKGKVGDVAISAAMLASLNALPTTVLAIGKLKKKDIEAFTKTLLAIQVTVNKFADGSKDIKGADNLVKVIKSLSDLEKVGLVKLATSLKIANTFGIAKSLTKFVEGVSNAAKKAGKISKSDLNKLEAVSKNMKAFSTLTKGLALMMGTVIGMAIAIKAIGSGPILKSVALTLGVLTALSALAVGVGILSKRMTGAIKGLRDVAKFILLIQGAVIGTLLIGLLAQKAWPQILKGFGVISGIILGYTAVAVLASLMMKTVSMNKVALMTVLLMAGYGMAITLGTLLVGAVAEHAWPQILVGFGVISGIILGYVAVAALASFLFKFVTMNKASLMMVMLMAGFGMALTLGTLLMSYVAQEAWPDILIGFGTISGIILGYTAIAALISVIGKLSPTFKKDVLAIVLMAGITMGLVLGTLLIGCVAEEALPDILIGFGAMSLIIMGFAGLGALVSKVAKGLGKFQKDFITLGLFAAECEALLLGTVAIAWVTKKAGVTVGEIALTIAGVATIAGGLLLVAKELQASKLGSSKKAIATLKELSLIGFACEGLLAGVIGLAILAKKADPAYIAGTITMLTGVVYGLVKITEYLEKHNKSVTKGAKNLLLVEAVALGAEAVLGGIIVLAIMAKKADPVYIIGTVAMLAGIVWGLTMITEFMEKHNRSLVKGAKNLLLVEAVALGAEAVLGGIILLARQINDPKLAYQIPIVITIIGGIIMGVIGLVELIEKHKKTINEGAKSMLLVEAVALGAEAILGGVLGLIWLKNKTGASELEIIGTIVLIGGIVTGLVGVLKLIEKHNKDLQKGAKSLLMLEGVALGAEAVLAGVIGIIVLAKKTNTGAGEIAAVIGAIGVIITGLVGILNLVEKNNKELQKGAKSLAIVVACAAGAGLVLAEAIGIEKLRKVAGVEWGDIALVMTAMIGIVTAFGTLAVVAGKFDKYLKKGIKSLALVELLALGAGALLTGVIGIIAFKNAIDASWEDIYMTIGAMATIVAGFGALAIVVGVFDKQVKNALPGLGVISLFALAAGALLAGVLGLIALKNAVKSDWGDVFITIGAMATIVTAFGVLALAVSVVSSMITTGLAGIGVITLFAVAAGALLAGVIGLIALKNAVKAEWSDVFITIGAMATIVTAFGVLGAAVGFATPFITPGLAGIGVITLFAVAAGALLAGVIGLIALKNTVKAEWSDVFITIGAMSTIVGAFGLLGAAVGLATPFITPGLAGIGVITLFALAAEALLAGVIGLIALKNSVKAEWGDVFIIIGAMTTIVGAFGLLGAAVGLASPFIALGLLGMPTIVTLAGSAELLLFGIMELIDTKNKVKASWEDVDTTLGKMEGIIKSFGLLGAAVGLASPFIAMGLLSMPTILSLGASSALVLGGVVEIVDKKNKAKASWEDIDTTLEKMEGIIKSYGLIGAAIGLASPIIAPALLAVPSILSLGESGVLILDGVIDLVDKKQKAKASWDDIDITLGKMEGVVKSYGLISAAASLALPFILAGSAGLLAAIETAQQTSLLMGEVVKVTGEAKNLGRDGWEQIDKTLTYMNMILVGDDTSNRPGFKQLCSSASLAYPFLVAGAAGLEEVALTARTSAKALVEVCKAAKTAKDYDAQEIMDVISYFGNITDALYNIVGVEFAIKAGLIGNQKDLIQDITTSAMNIATALANMAGVAKEGGFMRSSHVKANGEFAFGPWVNAKGSTETIAETMSYFVNTLYDTFDKIDAASAGKIENGMKVLQNILEPVSNFAVAMSAFQEAGEGKIRQIKYNDKGKLINTPAVDVKHVAKVIGSAISTFCQELFSDENQHLWENIIQGGSSSTQTTKDESGKTTMGLVYQPGAAERAMGVLATIISPVAKFAETLAMFSKGDDDEIYIPAYDEKGNLKPQSAWRKVNLVDVAKSIGSAVAQFVETLTSETTNAVALYENMHRGAEYTSVGAGWFGLKKEAKQVKAERNMMEQAFGCFGKILTPVVAFAGLLKMFQDQAGDKSNPTLLVFDENGNSHIIHPKTIAQNIALAISSFIEALSVKAFTTTGAGFSFDSFKSQSNIISEAVNNISTTIEALSGVDADNINNFSKAFSDVMKIIYESGSDNNTKLINTAGTSINTLADSIDKLTTNLYGGNENAIVATLTSMNTLFKDISTQGAALSSIITFFQDLKTNSENFSNVVDSSVVASITTLTSSLPKASDALKESQEKFNKAVNDKRIGIKPNADKMTVSFNKTTISIKNFDTALSGNNNKRIANLKNLKDAVAALNSATDGIEGRLANVASALKALATISTENASNNISKVVAALGNLKATGGGSGEGGTTNITIDSKEIAAAIAHAFDETEIRLKKNDDQFHGYLNVNVPEYGGFSDTFKGHDTPKTPGGKDYYNTF